MPAGNPLGYFQPGQLDPGLLAAIQAYSGGGSFQPPGMGGGGLNVRSGGGVRTQPAGPVAMVPPGVQAGGGPEPGQIGSIRRTLPNGQTIESYDVRYPGGYGQDPGGGGMNLGVGGGLNFGTGPNILSALPPMQYQPMPFVPPQAQQPPSRAQQMDQQLAQSGMRRLQPGEQLQAGQAYFNRFGGPGNAWGVAGADPAAARQGIVDMRQRNLQRAQEQAAAMAQQGRTMSRGWYERHGLPYPGEQQTHQGGGQEPAPQPPQGPDVGTKPGGGINPNPNPPAWGSFAAPGAGQRADSFTAARRQRPRQGPDNRKPTKPGGGINPAPPASGFAAQPSAWDSIVARSLKR